MELVIVGRERVRVLCLSHLFCLRTYYVWIFVDLEQFTWHAILSRFLQHRWISPASWYFFVQEFGDFVIFLLHVHFTHGFPMIKLVRMILSQMGFPRSPYVILKIAHIFLFSPFANFVDIFCSHNFLNFAISKCARGALNLGSFYKMSHTIFLRTTSP
jgi:hypothetical protein